MIVTLAAMNTMAINATAEKPTFHWEP